MMNKMEITLHNVNPERFNEGIAALNWFAGLDEINRYLAVDAIQVEQWSAVEQLVAAAILYVGARPQQTEINVEALYDLAMLLTLRFNAGEI